MGKAPQYSSKGRSVQQESWVAAAYGGTVSPSSGASAKDAGDVRTPRMLIECKQTGQMDKPAKSYSLKVSDLEKAWDEATSEGLDMAIAVRIYAPDSPLANHKGNIDLIVRRVMDDMEREQTYVEVSEGTRS